MVFELSDISLKIHLEKDKNGKYKRIKITPDPQEIGVTPKKVESGLLYRLAEKYATEGNPSVGKSWIISIEDQSGSACPRIIAAVTLTNIKGRDGILKGKRLMIWPACDVTQCIRWSNGKKINLNHISFESKGEKVFRHVTGTGRTKVKQRESDGGVRRVGNDYVLGRFFIKNFDSLDRLIETLVELNSSFTNQKIDKDLPDLEAGIQDHLHPLLSVPSGAQWGKGAFICAEFRLSDNNKNDAEWPIFVPKDHINRGEELHGHTAPRQSVCFEIEPGLFLKIGVTILDADLSVPLIWIDEDSELRAAYTSNGRTD